MNDKPLTLILLMLGMFLSIAVPALYYISVFPFRSSDHALWAEFGNFYGGTAGVFIAGIAILGVVGTLWLQQKQIDRNDRIIESQLLLNAAESALERAHALLAPADQELPSNNPFSWIAAARSVAAAERAAAELLVPYSKVYKAASDFQKLRLLGELKCLETLESSHWVAAGEHGDRYWVWQRDQVRNGIGVNELQDFLKGVFYVHDWLYSQERIADSFDKEFGVHEAERMENVTWRGLGGLAFSHVGNRPEGPYIDGT